MARVTVEDCLQHVDNRFELVLIASKRARQIAKEGIDPLVPWDDDKPAVVALREIADDLLPKQAVQQVLSIPQEVQHEAVESSQATVASDSDEK